MKKLLLLVLALMLVLSLVACRGDKETTGDSDTETPIDSTTEPETTTTEPDESSTEPEVTDPEVTEPEATEPEATEPEATEPEDPDTPDDPDLPVDPSAFLEVRETVYVCNTETLNIRESYSADSALVGTMKEGESVVRTGYNAEWSRISYYGETRYASSAYLTTVAPFVYTNEPQTVYVNVAKLNLRAKASSEATILYTLDYGTALQRTGVSTTKDEAGNEWSRILYNGQVCFANSVHLSTTASVSDTLVFVEQNDKIYTIAETAVNLREDASISSKIVASLPYGTCLERMAIASAPDTDGVTWSRVSYNGTVCYITSSPAYITTTPTVAFAEADETLYVTGDLNMRSTPSFSESTVIRTLAKGTQVHCIGKASVADADGITWYKVEIDGVTGYASGAYLATELPA